MGGGREEEEMLGRRRGRTGGSGEGGRARGRIGRTRQDGGRGTLLLLMQTTVGNPGNEDIAGAMSASAIARPLAQ